MANMTFKTNLLPNSDLGYSLGDSSHRWKIYGANINETITVQTGSTTQAHIDLSTLLTWLITTKKYIPQSQHCQKILQCSWSYAGNDILQFNAYGKNMEMQLAGVFIEFIGYASTNFTTDNSSHYRIIFHTSPTRSFTVASGYIAVPLSSTWEYIYNGSSYEPIWKCWSHTLDYNSGLEVQFGYSTSGMGSTSWLGSWDGYNLRAIAPANALKSAIGTSAIGAAGTPIYWNGSNFVAGNAAASSGHTHNYLPLSGGTMTGAAIGKTTSSSWIDGQKYALGGWNLTDATDTGSYWPWMRQTNTSSSKWFSMGALNNSLYIIGSTTSRTENGYDYGWRFDVSNGYMYGNVSGTLDGNAATATKLATARNIAITGAVTGNADFDGSGNISIATTTNHEHIKINSRGKITCETGGNKPAITGLSMSNVANNGYPTTYGNVMTMYGSGAGQLLLGWSGSSTTSSGARADAYIRSQRDTAGTLWSDWYNLLDSGNYTTYTVKKDGTGASGTWGISITGNAATATALGTNAGGTEQPIYFTGGKPSATSYALKATVNNGTSSQIAYYSGDRAISGSGGLRYYTGNSTASTPAAFTRLHIYGSTYGNTAANLISGTAGLFSFGDGGPQITFDTSATPGGSQAGALIFTDHDSAASGASWHFVSNQGDWNVTSKRFHARTSISVGSDLPNTSYNLYVKGTGCFTDNLRVVSNGIWVQGGSNAGSNNSRMTLTAGMPTGLQYNSSQRGTRIYSNAIAFADPYNGNSNNDSGWIRHIEETANTGILEIATGDDGSNEQIVARQYNTSSTVAAEIKLLDSSHNSVMRTIVPTATNTYTLGSSSLLWNRIYTNGVGVDDSMTVHPSNSNELNFGGTNNSSTIYFGYRAWDSKPIPTKFIFGGSTGSADLQAKTVYLGSGTTSYISSSQYTGKAATAGTADKISNITTADAASSSDTWRNVWISYIDNATGRPAYDADLAYQTSTDTLKSGKYQLKSKARIEYNDTTNAIDFIFI